MNDEQNQDRDWFNELMKRYANSRPAHRREFTDMEWAEAQSQGPASYEVGDLVQFMEGGFGIIYEVSQAQNGWPVSYSCRKAKGYPDHPETKRAWFYEGDIKRRVIKASISIDPD